MLPQLGILTTSIKLKAAFLATAMVISSTQGFSSFDITATQPITAYNSVTLEDINHEIAILKNEALWKYLRGGLNYVEASGEEVPTDFVHPGGVAYGPLALTRIAIRDVLQHYNEFRDYSVSDILSDARLYEKCAKLYSDLLLRHYLKIDRTGLAREEIFNILQKAWFLGPTQYKQGKKIPRSRMNGAHAYILSHHTVQ